jgi:large subunit ribosomal protein L1
MGKRMKAIQGSYDAEKKYSLSEALSLVKKNATAKFDETVELHVKEAKAAGADFSGDADLIEKISKGWLDFDVLVATPDVMKDLTKLGKVLGPKGLMPNPKSGTVTFDVGRVVKELKAGRVEFKMDESGNLHTAVGKASFAVEDLVENAQTILNSIASAKPPTAKGVYINSVTLTSTMGAGVRLAYETIV